MKRGADIVLAGQADGRLSKQYIVVCQKRARLLGFCVFQGIGQGNCKRIVKHFEQPDMLFVIDVAFTGDGN